MTNLAVMRFAPDGILEVASLMPGATSEAVRDNTAFDLRFRAEGLFSFRPLTTNQVEGTEKRH